MTPDVLQVRVNIKWPFFRNDKEIQEDVNDKIIAITKSGEITDLIILPPDCPDQAKQAVDILKLEISMLNRIIAEKDERILLYQQLLNR
jgi:hypothetical protein